MNEKLRTCPLCQTPVDRTVHLGLRDFRWVADALPGRVAPTDFDSVLEKNGRFLVLELKPPGGSLPMGQRLTFKALVRTGFFDVWVVWETKAGETVEVGVVDRHGNVSVPGRTSTESLAQRVRQWYDDAGREA